MKIGEKSVEIIELQFVVHPNDMWCRKRDVLGWTPSVTTPIFASKEKIKFSIYSLYQILWKQKHRVENCINITVDYADDLITRYCMTKNISKV